MQCVFFLLVRIYRPESMNQEQMPEPSAAALGGEAEQEATLLVQVLEEWQVGLSLAVAAASEKVKLVWRAYGSRE